MSKAYALSATDAQSSPAAEMVESCQALVAMLVELRTAALRMDPAEVMSVAERMDRQLAAVERLGQGLGDRARRAIEPQLAPIQERLRLETLTDQEIIGDLLAYIELCQGRLSGDGRAVYDPRGKWRSGDFPIMQIDEEV